MLSITLPSSTVISHAIELSCRINYCDGHQLLSLLASALDKMSLDSIDDGASRRKKQYLFRIGVELSSLPLPYHGHIKDRYPRELLPEQDSLGRSLAANRSIVPRISLHIPFVFGSSLAPSG